MTKELNAVRNLMEVANSDVKYQPVKTVALEFDHAIGMIRDQAVRLQNPLVYDEAGKQYILPSNTLECLTHILYNYMRCIHLAGYADIATAALALHIKERESTKDKGGHLYKLPMQRADYNALLNQPQGDLANQLFAGTPKP